MQSQFRSIQGDPGAAEKETAYFGCSQCIIKKLFDFLYYQTDRVLIVGAPVNPFLIFDVFDQSQDSCGDFRRRLDILGAFRVWGPKLLIRDAKSEWMIWPKTLVLQHQVLGNGAMSIEGQNNRFHQKVSLSSLSAAGKTSHDLTSLQVHLRGSSQDRFDQRASPVGKAD